MQPEQQQRIMGYFIEEAKDHLNTIEQGLLNLQSTIEDPEMANEVFRAAHSVKGGAAMLGINSIQKTAHRLEDYFKVLKECPVKVDQTLESFFLRIFDALQDLLEHLQGPFGLTEDKSNEIMSEVEPVFDALHNHLNLLVTQAGGVIETEAAPASVSAAAVFSQPAASGRSTPKLQEESALQLIFQSDVPGRLREMLQLFKQPDQLESRQQLQDICRSLSQAGEQFDLRGWCGLLEAARLAIANPENTFRTLAPVVIKEIKQAQDLVLASRFGEIGPTEKLQELLPTVLPSEPGVAAADFGDLLAIADEPNAVTAAAADLDLVDDLISATDEADTDSPLSAAEFEFGSLGSDDTAADAVPPQTGFQRKYSLGSESPSAKTAEHTGPEVGMAELNSLADLFENEAPGLGITWQEEEMMGDASSEAITALDLDDSSDFSDLFDEPSSENLTTTSPSDDLASLFGDSLLDEDSNELDFLELSNQTSDIADLLAIDAAEQVDPNLPELADLDTFDFTDELTEAVTPEDEFANLFDENLGDNSAESLGFDSSPSLDLSNLSFTDSDTSTETQPSPDDLWEFSAAETTDIIPDGDLTSSPNLAEATTAADSLSNDEANVRKLRQTSASLDNLSDLFVGLDENDLAFPEIGYAEPLALELETSADPFGGLSADGSSSEDDGFMQLPDLETQTAATELELGDLWGSEEDLLASGSTTADATESFEQDLLNPVGPAESGHHAAEPNTSTEDLSLDFTALDASPWEDPELTVTSAQPELFTSTHELETSEVLDLFADDTSDTSLQSDDVLSSSLFGDEALVSETIPEISEGDFDLGDLFETTESSDDGQDGSEEGVNHDLFSDTPLQPDPDVTANLWDEALGEDVLDLAFSDDTGKNLDAGKDFTVEERSLEADLLETPTSELTGLEELAWDDSDDNLPDLFADHLPGTVADSEDSLDLASAAEPETKIDTEEIGSQATAWELSSPFDQALGDELDEVDALDLFDTGLAIDSTTATDSTLGEQPTDSLNLLNDESDADLDDLFGATTLEASPTLPDLGPAEEPGAFTADALEEWSSLSTGAEPAEDLDDLFGAKASPELDQAEVSAGDWLNFGSPEAPEEDLNTSTANADEFDFGSEIGSNTGLDDLLDAELGEPDPSTAAFSSAEALDLFSSASITATNDLETEEFSADLLDWNQTEELSDFSNNLFETTDDELGLSIDPAEDPTEAADIENLSDNLFDLGMPADPELDTVTEATPTSEDALFDLDAIDTADSAELSSAQWDAETADFLGSDLVEDSSDPFGLDQPFETSTTDVTAAWADNLELEVPEATDLSSTSEPAELEVDDNFGDLEALLDTEPPVVPLSGETSNPATAGSTDLDDFSDLEALLGEELPVSPSGPSAQAAFSGGTARTPELGTTSAAKESRAVDTEFDDLEKLLEAADQTMGGSPTVTTSRRQSPQLNRRPKGAVEQNMRVSVKHLDNLSNLVGELVVNRNSLEQDQERLRQFLDNLLYQVQQLSDVGQRMRDLYERSLLEDALLSTRMGHRSSFSGNNSDQSSHPTGVLWERIEMDRFTPFHSLSQEMIELIVRVRESASDIEFIVDETDQVTRLFRQVTTQLQEGLTRSRMVPFAQIADRLPRAVRDIAIKCGRQAELQVEGRETLIDKMILEQLYDPMTHLVNNAITHGIESPEVRKAAGKPPVGRISIQAFHQGNQTILSVSDDGAGIDPERVKAKALEKGLITPAEAQTMSRLDVYDLLFHPGFSTKDQADAFSGRGVGMDVVRTSLSEIRGAINTDSTVGKGTTFTIRLPLTLSISKALCCVSNRARIAFPMDGVEDMLDVPKERIQVDETGQACILWRDALLPFRPLSELLKYNRQLGRGSVYAGSQEEDIVSIVVLRSAGNFIALQVDQVLGEQEIVIKQLEGPVPKPIGVAGATVLGDGRIMPIADVLELIDLAMGRTRREVGGTLWDQQEAQTPPEPQVAKSEPTVLIVDDSITVRELLSMTFNKIGYRVVQARDGQEAWEQLRSGLPCDIVFCDIEMPRMDGLELLSRIQKDSSLNHLPIAMLTSRGADRHRQMAAQLGAKGYFTKPYLEEALLEAAQRMLKGEMLIPSSSKASS